MSSKFRIYLTAVVLIAVAGTTAFADTAADQAALKQALGLKPVQQGVDYTVPTGEEIATCSIQPVRVGQAVGWLISDPSGLPLRRFLDSNADGNLDRWCYFKDGLEVYRDIDNDFNRKTDEYRWYNTAGTRKGIDQNEDGHIDAWKTISAEEAADEAIQAIATNNPRRFALVALSSKDLATLDLSKSQKEQLTERLKKLAAQFQQAVASKKIQPGSAWLQWSAFRPGVVPAASPDGDGVPVYENVMAVIESGATHQQLGIGTMIRVGNVWKLVGPPQLESADSVASNNPIFFRPPESAPGVNIGVQVSERMQKLVEEMEKIDQALNTARTPAETAQLTGKRADLVEQIATVVSTPEDRRMWIQQLIDMIGAAAQSGNYPAGVARLETLFQRLSKNAQDRDLAAYARFRGMTASYNLGFQVEKPDYAKIQEKWLADLQQFVKDFPKTSITPEAMLQLAVTLEYEGKADDAKKWYEQIVKQFPSTVSAKKASGCYKRLGLVGKVLDFSGTGITGETVNLAQYRGRHVLLQYWATWCEPCTAAFPTLAALQKKYQGKFYVVGVCLDSDHATATNFLKQNPTPWAQVYEQGGLESRPALELGILSPLMILIDPAGKVVAVDVRADQIESKLQPPAPAAPAVSQGGTTGTRTN